MNITQVYIPERKQPVQEMMSQGQNLVGGIQTGRTIGSWFKGKPPAGTTGQAPAGGTETAATGGSETYAGSTYAAPTAGGNGYSLGVTPYQEYSGPTSLQSESAGSAVGPVAIGTGSMAFGAKAQSDTRLNPNAGNAPYAPKDMNPSIHYDSETLGNRYGALREAADPAKFFEAKKTVDLLPFSRDTKDNMMAQLSKAMNLSKMMKRG